MKKLINLLSLFLIINLLISANLLIKISNYNNLLPISYVKTSIDDNYNLIVRILKDANKNNLISYANYINLKIINTIPNDKENKVAFTLSLPQQLSFIAIYDKIGNNEYKFKYIIDDLASIDNFYIYKKFLIVEQSDTIDSNNKKFFEVFFKTSNKYSSVFTKNIYNENIIKSTEDNDSNMDIFKEIEISSIDYLEGDLPRIICINTITKYKGIYSALSSSYEFIEVDKTTKKEIYEWSNEKKVFVLKDN